MEFNDWPAKKLIKRLLVNIEDLESHILAGERCQGHHWTHFSSQVSLDERSLRA